MKNLFTEVNKLSRIPMNIALEAKGFFEISVYFAFLFQVCQD